MGVKLSDVQEWMQELAQKRPIFHSEADFQHALALHLSVSHRREIRVEYPIGNGNLGWCDIAIMADGKPFAALELKYMTAAAIEEIGEEKFNLKAQGAQDIRRYDVWKDAFRLEELMNKSAGVRSTAVIALSNDSAYWRGGQAETAQDRAFCLREEEATRVVTGSLGWKDRTPKGTTGKNRLALTLHKNYRPKWFDYGDQVSSKTRFRYLVLYQERDDAPPTEL